MCACETTSIVQQIVDYRNRSESEEAVTLVGTVMAIHMHIHKTICLNHCYWWFSRGHRYVMIFNYYTHPDSIYFCK